MHGTHHGNVTGETFRNGGKTDIHIPFGDHIAWPDSHLVDSMGEVHAAEIHGLKPFRANWKAHDDEAPVGRLVQVKTTQRKSVGINEEPDYLIVLYIDDYLQILWSLAYQVSLQDLSAEGRDRMRTIVDVAAYILDEYGSMTTMKLQKLAFYSQAHRLATRNTPLFPEDFQAWVNGPVAPELYREHVGCS